jgi:hypothetical protein
MTVLSRGARSRRGGRRPGWPLLTALLVLAIAASSALVFTDRVELLKLAVILALWAAVVAAFVSVIYRRQSDADAAKARDLKLVYDLQLDREISARREYELTVESQLRRELATELRAQAADEVAALRAELAALRNNLEILFDTELTHRPAIETERTTVRAYSDWARDTTVTDTGQKSAVRFRQEVDVDTGENRIIDVPEEPLGRRHLDEEPLGRRHLDEQPQGVNAGVHHGPSENGGFVRPAPEPGPVFRPEAPPQPAPEPAAAPAAAPAARHDARREPDLSGSEWNPVQADGQWLPPGRPGSNWVSSTNGVSAHHAPLPEPTPGPAAPEPPRGRHAGPGEEGQAPFAATAEVENDRTPEDAPTAGSQHGQGQSVAELLARLQATPTGGGRRRRRED